MKKLRSIYKNFFFNQNKESNSKLDEKTKEDQLINIGKKIKKRREENEISRFQLSKRTKISIAVIQALESGWLSQLPEDTYLYTMLKILDKELILGLDSSNSFYSKISGNNTLEKSWSINNSSIISGWQGRLIYFSCLFLTLYLINKYQLILLQNNVETVIPMKINDIDNNGNNIQ